MLANLISWIARPLIKALFSEITHWIKKELAKKDIEKLRIEKQKLHEIARKMHEAKHLDDKEASQVSADLSSILHKL